MTSAPALALIAPDAAAWDMFVRAHPHGSLLQRDGWGALKAQFGWNAQRLAVLAPAGICAGAQVLFKRRFGVAAAYIPRGPLWSGVPAADQLLLRALDHMARRNRAIFLRLEPNMLADAPAAAALHSALLLAGFQPTDTLQPRSSVHLDLAPDTDRLLAAISKGHRADIRRATRDGVAVRVGTTAADLAAFYAIMQSTGARAEFGIHSRDYYAAAWRAFSATDDVLLLLAEWQGAPVATAMLFADGHASLYLYSGSTPAGLKSGAQHAIQWQAIQWAKAHGCGFYDLWGVPDAFGQAAQATDETARAQLEEAAKADPLHGVYRFKKGFGGRVVRYLPAYDRVYIPALYRLWRQRMA